MSKVKICGIMNLADVAIVNDTQPDYVGFVFASGRHYITLDQAATLKAKLSPRIQSVGVFVNADMESIQEASDRNIIDIVQLHGDEDESYLVKLKQRIQQPIIKAVRVQNQEQIIAAEQMPCDMLLLDSYQLDAYGGSGSSFDHTLIPTITKPYFLAGGLSIDTIEQVIRCYQPDVVDISSSVEIDAHKDATLVKAIIERVRTL